MQQLVIPAQAGIHCFTMNFNTIPMGLYTLAMTIAGNNISTFWETYRAVGGVASGALYLIMYFFLQYVLLLLLFVCVRNVRACLLTESSSWLSCRYILCNVVISYLIDAYCNAVVALEADNDEVPELSNEAVRNQLRELLKDVQDHFVDAVPKQAALSLA